jgi:hypothetical protein
MPNTWSFSMTDTTAVHGAPGSPAPAQGPFLLHVWMVAPQCADRHIRLLTELFDMLSGQPGFVSARILESSGRSSIAAIVETQSVEHRRRLEQLPQVRDVLHQVPADASLVAQPYRDVAFFEARWPSSAAS